MTDWGFLCHRETGKALSKAEKHENCSSLDEKNSQKYLRSLEKVITFALLKGIYPYLGTGSGCSSVRFRVYVWGAWGRWFESSHPDQSKNKAIIALNRQNSLVFLLSSTEAELPFLAKIVELCHK